MKGVILAAGVGSRLRPLTDSRPKCLVRVGGRCLLDLQLDSYRIAGIRDVVVVVGHCADAVREHCSRIEDMQITVVENQDYLITNNMYSLHLAQPHIRGRSFMLNNADLAVGPEVAAILRTSSHPDAIAVDMGQYNEESMKVRLDGRGLVGDISKVISPLDAAGCSIDYYKFSDHGSEALFGCIDEFLAGGDRNQWTELALQRLLVEGRLSMAPVSIEDQPWVEIDDYADLAAADRLFSDFDFDLDGVDTVFLDFDGTLFIGEQLIPGADAFVGFLRDRSKAVRFLSNNSSKGKEQYVAKLRRSGIEAEESEIVLSTDGLVNYLSSEDVKSVYVLGTDALRDRIEAAGIDTRGRVPAELVVVGYDTELTYNKLVEASRQIHEGAAIVATHCDVVCPTERGPVPDAGTLIELLRMTTGKTPLKVFGKPEPGMVAHLLGGQDPARALVVGDRLYTDMELGRRLGAQSALVLTGETTRDHLESAEHQPSVCVPSVYDLIPEHARPGLRRAGRPRRGSALLE